MKKVIFVALSFALPLVSSAQATFAGNGAFKVYLNSILDFVNTYVIPLIIAASVLVIIWGIFKYLIVGGTDEESRAKGKQILIWGILGLVFILSIYGIINLVNGIVGIPGDSPAPTGPVLPPIN